jgi:hypothetical protein
MKSPILILCFIAFYTSLFAQNPRIETFGDRRIEAYWYAKGFDSVRYTVRGKNDTFKIEKLHRSGKTDKITWQKDSMYEYDVLGRLESKQFGIYKRNDVPNDSSVYFYENGQIQRIKKYSNNTLIEKYFNKEGKTLKTRHTFHTPSVYYMVDRDRNGVLMLTERIDTLIGGDEPKFAKYDTLYYDNEHIYKTSASIGDESLGSQQYNMDGSVRETILPDSLKLIEFKDNVDCYYGLKNKRGDTIIKARFDRFETFYPNTWGGYVGDQLFLFDNKGAPMSIFPPNLTSLTGIYRSRESMERMSDDIDISQRYGMIDTVTSLYTFSQGKKHGVVSETGAVILPPQNFNIARLFVNNAFFHFEDWNGFRLKKSGYINLEGKPIFYSDEFTTVMYANYKDYFFLSQQPYQVPIGCTSMTSSNSDQASTNFNGEILNTFGLGKSDCTLLLERKFHDITHVGNSPLFMTTLLKRADELDDFTQHNGVFNTQTRRWLLDSIGFSLDNSSRRQSNFFVIQQLSNKKYGIMDTVGRYLLPLSYDSIGVADNGLYWVKKGRKYQLFEIKNGKPYLHKTQYDYLEATKFEFHSDRTTDYIIYFFAQRGGKWGLIDVSENTIKPFEFDYIAIKSDYDKRFIMVKDNQAAHFTLSSLPNPMPNFPHTEDKYASTNSTDRYTLVNNANRFCIINETGKVLVPPQYKMVSNDNNGVFILIEDDKKQKKLVFLRDGKQVDYPFDYDVAWASALSNLIIVRDKDEVSYGVVTTEGKQVMPCKNYGIAISDCDSSIFFVKQDTPLIKRQIINGKFDKTSSIAVDSLNSEDQNWLMYNAKGALLSDTPFRFPFDFHQNIAIGMKENAFNLYKYDGSIQTPFFKTKSQMGGNTEGGQNASLNSSFIPKGFNNIRREEATQFYILFYNQGLTPTLMLTKKTGEIVLNGGKYDGISKFYGKYALVSAVGKIGLIDTLGEEIIAPQDIRTYTGNLMDSLNIVNKEWYNEWVANGKKGWCQNLVLPIKSANYYEAYHPDSLNLSATQKSTLWNLLLDKIRVKTINTASDLFIERVESRASAPFLSFDAHYNDNIKYRHGKIIVEDNTVCYILEDEESRKNDDYIFHNYYRRNNRWEYLPINDLLQIQGEKRWQMNDLITKKVKALKDEQINCSNASAFITTVENRWMLTKTGIDFCFESTNKGFVFTKGDYVSVSFTWAELAPFLKMKIF